MSAGEVFSAARVCDIADRLAQDSTILDVAVGRAAHLLSGEEIGEVLRSVEVVQYALVRVLSHLSLGSVGVVDVADDMRRVLDRLEQVRES